MRRRLPVWLRWSKLDRRRRKMAARHVQWLEREARVVRDGKVTHGRDGWLFLADDSNDAFAQHTGERRLSAEQLDRWTALIERRLDFTAALGAEYFFLVAPETHSLYPEMLPPGTPHAPERPVHQLMSAQREKESPLAFLYPLEELLAAKTERPVSSRFDSHWTDFGAFVAYSALLDRIEGAVPVRRLAAEEIAFTETIAAGDLGNKLVPARVGVLPAATVRFPEARLVFDNCIENTGSVVITECRQAPPTTCVLVGDSYSYSLIKFLSESFGRLVVVHSASFDPRILRDAEPDVVVSLMAERFLIEVPDDVGETPPGVRDRGLALQERHKRRDRRTRPPLCYWTGPRWLSPLAAERLRAHLLAEGRIADATMISVLAYGGLLPRELTLLRWRDVSDGEIHVRKEGGGRRNGTQHGRTVTMIEPLADDLRQWRALAGDPALNAHVFPGRLSPHWANGEWGRWCREVFEPAVRACGLEIERPHDLRHALCTLLLQQGISVREVGRQVGDKPRVLREIYHGPIAFAREWEPIDASRYVYAIRGRRPREADDAGVAVPVASAD